MKPIKYKHSHFESLITGKEVPEKVSAGKVLSVYENAVNILIPGNILVSVLGQENMLTAMGVLLQNFSSFRSSATVGTSVDISESTIFAGDMSISLDTGSFWGGKLEASGRNINGFKTFLNDLFPGAAEKSGFSPILTGINHNPFSKMAEKIIGEALSIIHTDTKPENREKGNKPEGLDFSGLIGLGQGFTPSGDDFLTGILLCENYSGKSVLNRKRIYETLSGTTSGGKTLLYLALKDSFPFYLLKFIRDLDSAVEESGSEAVCKKLETAVFEAVAHGSSSGSDALTGFIWCINFLTNLS